MVALRTNIACLLVIGNLEILPSAPKCSIMLSSSFQVGDKYLIVDGKWLYVSSGSGMVPIWHRILMRSSPVRADKPCCAFSARPSFIRASFRMSFGGLPSTHRQHL